MKKQILKPAYAPAMALNWPGHLKSLSSTTVPPTGLDTFWQSCPAETECLRVIEGVDLPQGWLGKPHALHLGQQKAQGEWLWFVDADVILKPNALRLLYQADKYGGRSHE